MHAVEVNLSLLSSGRLCFRLQDNGADNDDHDNRGGPTPLSAEGARQQPRPATRAEKGGGGWRREHCRLQSGATRKGDDRQRSGLGATEDSLISMGYDEGKDNDISCKREGGGVEDDEAVEAAAGREGRGAPMTMLHHHVSKPLNKKLLPSLLLLYAHQKNVGKKGLSKVNSANSDPAKIGTGRNSLIGTK